MRLITLLLFSIKSKSSYHFNVLSMLQSGTMNGILPDNIVIDIRMVIVSIVLVLSERLEGKLRSSLINFAESRKRKEGDEDEDVSNVNKMVGWAIFDLRKKKYLSRKKFEEGSEEEIMVYNEIMFSEIMRFKKNDAIKNLEYVGKCYDSVIRSYDRGDLSLANEYYFEIWNKVMRIGSKC